MALGKKTRSVWLLSLNYAISAYLAWVQRHFELVLTQEKLILVAASYRKSKILYKMVLSTVTKPQEWNIIRWCKRICIYIYLFCTSFYVFFYFIILWLFQLLSIVLTLFNGQEILQAFKCENLVIWLILSFVYILVYNIKCSNHTIIMLSCYFWFCR